MKEITTNKAEKSRKILKKALLVAAIILLIVVIAFFILVSDYYRAECTLNEYENYEIIDNYTVLLTEQPTDTAMIFYPGALVEHTAYLPLLDSLRDNGIMCVIVKMPFNMAIFNVNGANGVFELYPDITNWYMSGHSMGGGMASSYASKNQDLVQGLILMGAYVYGDYPVEKALTIYGTFNDNLEEYIYYTENIVIIDGGNHAQFGNYGEQKGDPPATITPKQQQDITVSSILNFTNKN